MADPRSLVVVSLATLVAPVLFLVALAVGAARARRDGRREDGTIMVLVATGSVSLGLFVLVGSSAPIVLVPILLAAGGIVAGLVRNGRRRGTGIALIGLGAPTLVAAAAGDPAPFGPPLGVPVDTAPVGAILVLAAGAAVAAGVTIALRRGSPARDAPDPQAAPLPRRPGAVAGAILEAAKVGPFSLPMVAALAVLVATWLATSVVAGLVGAPHGWVPAAGLVVGSVSATEAWLRAFPRPARRAFEALSWLGEREIRAARALVGPLPPSPGAARAWLEGHRAIDGDAGIRVEIAILAGRPEVARAAIASMPTGTPAERWARESADELLAWTEGRPARADDLRSALEAIPDGSDDRLAAEVAYGVAMVRRRLDRPGTDDVLGPLLAARDRLGAIADGQLGRALRVRMLATFLVAGAVLLVLGAVIGGP